MTTSETLIRDISDTARWVAMYRARESERPDARFNDPFARRLAGERGEKIAASMSFAEKNAWSFVARTWLVDSIIAEQVTQGVDTVLNLAAGLDARPYRMPLPPSLQWIEVDLPGILEYKAEMLRDERPACRLERIGLDLADVARRRELFARLGGGSKQALVVAEGLLVYLTEGQVGALAEDLAAPVAFRKWVIDLASPALLQMLRKHTAALAHAGLPLQFAPENGPDFFARHGWKVRETRSVLHAAFALGRLPLLLRLIARVSSQKFQARRPWSAVCLLAR
jgi:methyltransferase (TIGR00027 family)